MDGLQPRPRPVRRSAQGPKWCPLPGRPLVELAELARHQLEQELSEEHAGAFSDGLPLPIPKAQRRAPTQKQRFRSQFEKTQLCRFHAQGGCWNGEECQFAHGVANLSRKPDLTKTSICQEWLRDACALDREECKFAHGNSELRATTAFLKTALCTGFAAGKCKMGDSCRHAHTIKELQVRIEPDLLQQEPAMGSQSTAVKQKEAITMYTMGDSASSSDPLVPACTVGGRKGGGVAQGRDLPGWEGRGQRELGAKITELLESLTAVARAEAGARPPVDAGRDHTQLPPGPRRLPHLRADDPASPSGIASTQSPVLQDGASDRHQDPVPRPPAPDALPVPTALSASAAGAWTATPLTMQDQTNSGISEMERMQSEAMPDQDEGRAGPAEPVERCFFHRDGAAGLNGGNHGEVSGIDYWSL